jgi:hypothetical protein
VFPLLFYANLSAPSMAESAYILGAAVIQLRFKRPVDADFYNVLQRLSYLAVVFLFFPLIIAVTDNLKNIGKGLGSSAPEGGYSWYAGI